MAAPQGHCCICGTYGPLTFEHIPPEAAFNDQRMKLADIQRLLSNTDWESFENPRGGKFQQRGAGAYTLCGRCNSNTGHWYGAQYVTWAYAGMRHLGAVGSGSSLRLPFMITPLPVLKQIVAMFASACGPKFMDAYPELRQWLLNPRQSGVPDRLGIYCYFVGPDSRATRQSGVSGLMTLGGGNAVFAEIAFPPFGYLMCLDSRPLDGQLKDITFFGQFGLKEFRDIYLRVPVREVNSVFPGDFRTMEQIHTEYLANTKAAPVAKD